MDSSRIRTGEVVAGIGGIALFVFLFFDWFSGGTELTGTPGNLSLSDTGISGWDALTDLPGFLIILSAVAGIALACLAAAGQRVNIPVRRGTVTALLGALAVLLILWRMVAGTPTLKIGIFLGLAAAIAITVGALMALAEDGWEPFVAVAGERTRAAAATAPPATPSQPATEEVPASRSSSAGASPARRSTAKRSTTRKSSSRSGGGRGGSRTGGKRSTTSRSTASRSRSSGSRSTSSRSRSGGSRSTSSRSRSSSSKGRSSSSSSGSRSGGSRRSSGRKK